MGPALESIQHRSLLNPPVFKPQTDRLQWREIIRDWSTNVIACAQGGHKREKGVEPCLGRTIYRYFDASLKE